MKRISFALLTIIGLFIFTEVSLNIISYSFYRPKYGQNFRKNEHQKMFRILTLGESTTAPLYRDGIDISWPAILEKELKAKGYQVKVFNEGKSSITSSHVVETLVKSIDYYKPHLIIAMTGINDLNNLYYDQKNQDSVLDLKTFKLLRWISTAIKGYMNQSLSNKQWKAELTKAKSIVEKIKNAPSISFETDIKRAVEKSSIPEILLAQIYWDIVALKTKNDLNKFNLILQELSNYGTVHFPDSLRTINMRLDFLSKLDDKTKCRKYSEEIVKKVNLDAETQTRLGYCYPFEDENLSKLLPSSFKPRKTNQRYENINTIVSLAKERKTPVILMQYPTLLLTDLKNALPEASNVTFIENKINFQKTIAQKGYDYVFFDRFKKTWGHCTYEGNNLIVDNLFDQVVETIENH